MPEGTDKCFNAPKGYSRIIRGKVYPLLSLKDLLDAGLISEGDRLVWQKMNSTSSFEAVILRDGRIETKDGKIHTSPSTAARHVNAGISTNGWRVWSVTSKKKTLSQIRVLLSEKENPANSLSNKE